MKRIFFLVCAIGSMSAFSQTTPLTAEVQIKTAVLAAPAMYGDEATVLGYNKDGKLVTLREGSNGLVCLADDPNKEGISIACYGVELEPYMARGRQLIDEGKSEAEKREIRKKEIDEGKLKMPEEPAMVYVLSAEDQDLDRKTGELKNSKIRYVLYKPYMSGKSTGLPTKPQAPGMPWLMDADTHRSHIMITPVNK
jgi:hypothetical protein